ncbi:hypothetical protein, partial [Proteus mirabilis]|uniref:hypothetical protein n=1 Tax=Proteus mirabilis TaxID=584 RepID=UPI0013D899E1
RETAALIRAIEIARNSFDQAVLVLSVTKSGEPATPSDPARPELTAGDLQVTEGNAVPATEPSDEQDKPLAPDVGLGQAAVAVFEEEAGNP